MAKDEVPRHLEGLAGFVTAIQGGSLNERGKQIVERVLRTSQVVGVLVEPEGADLEVWMSVVNIIAKLSKSLVFIRGTLLDCDDNVILAPDGRFDPSAKLDSTSV